MGRPGLIVKGADGLLHCRACDGPDALCYDHRRQVAAALRDLKTSQILARAETELRWIVNRRWRTTTREEIDHEAATDSPD